MKIPAFVVLAVCLQLTSSAAFAEYKQYQLTGKDSVNFSKQVKLKINAKSGSAIRTLNICNVTEKIQKDIHWSCDAHLKWGVDASVEQGEVSLQLSGKMTEPEIDSIWSEVLANAIKNALEVAGELSN